MLPKNLKYQTKAESCNARAYTSLIQPQNNSSQTVAGQTITFNIPTGNNLVLNGAESYFHLNVAVTNGATASAYLRWASGGVQSLFQRVRIYCGGVLLEDIDNYNLLVAKLTALQSCQDSISGKQALLAGFGHELFSQSYITQITANIAQYGLVQGTSQPMLCGKKLVATAFGATPANLGANAVVNGTYGFQLVSSILGTMSEKYLPLFKMSGQSLRVEIQLVNDINKAFVTAQALASCVISNMEFCANLIELSDQAISIIDQSLMGQDLMYVVPQWRNYVNTNTIAENSTTTVNSLIPAKFTSLKSLIVVPRDRADGAATYDSLSSHPYSLSQYQFRFGGQVVPSKPPATTQEYFYELVKCIDCISNLNHTPLITPASYSNYNYVQANAEIASYPDVTTFAGQFALGIDCEIYSNADKTDLFSGMNTQGLDIYLQSTHAVANNGHGGRTTVRFDTFALYDAVLVFDQAGNCNIRT